jgi:hypothetical protein
LLVTLPSAASRSGWDATIDTPDGGRSHRRPLIDGLITAGHEIVFLQRNRDLHEAGHDLRHLYAWDDELPGLGEVLLPGVAFEVAAWPAPAS